MCFLPAFERQPIGDARSHMSYMGRIVSEQRGHALGSIPSSVPTGEPVWGAYPPLWAPRRRQRRRLPLHACSSAASRSCRIRFRHSIYRWLPAKSHCGQVNAAMVTVDTAEKAAQLGIPHTAQHPTFLRIGDATAPGIGGDHVERAIDVNQRIRQQLHDRTVATRSDNKAPSAARHVNVAEGEVCESAGVSPRRLACHKLVEHLSRQL